MIRNIFILMLIVSMAFVLPAFAVNLTASMGAKDSTNKAVLEVYSDNILYERPSGGIKRAYELATTSDTITAQETGKTFIYAQGSTTSTFTLPDADVGANFTFQVSAGDADGSVKIILDPQDTDTFRGVVNGTSTSTFAAGDSVISAGATGDALSIFCAEDTYWDVVDRTGTWSDNN